MSCDQLGGFEDDAEAVAHFAACSACRARKEALEADGRRLGDLVALAARPLSPALRDRVLAAAQGTAPAVAAPRSAARTAASVLAFALVAASLTLALLPSSVVPVPPPPTLPTVPTPVTPIEHTATVTSSSAPLPASIASCTTGGGTLLDAIEIATPAEIHSLVVNRAITDAEERELLVALRAIASVDSDSRVEAAREINLRMNVARKRNLEILERDAKAAAPMPNNGVVPTGK